MMKKLTAVVLLLLGFFGCQNLEDASPDGISSFIRLYEKAGDFIATAVEVLPEGYAMVGYTGVNENAEVVFTITDFNGNVLRQTTHPGSTSKSLLVLKDDLGRVTGFIVTGDVIETNPGIEPVANQEIISSKVMKLDINGELIQERLIQDLSNNIVKIDFKSSALTQKNSDTLLLLGSYKTVLTEPEKPFLAGFSENLDSLWFNNFPSLDRTYINAKTVFYNNGNVIWASAKLKQTGDFSDSFLSIPLVPELALTPTNDSPFKQLSSQLLIANELQIAHTPEFGYGVIGTIASTSGQLANLVFVRADNQGNFKEGSERYFDAQLGVTEQENSSIQDTGDALFATSDGGFILAGTSLSTPTFGNGGRDVLLIKLDAFGTMQWKRIIGGTGDETVCAVRESKGGYLICGSSNLGALTSVFLIKTDKNGALQN